MVRQENSILQFVLDEYIMGLWSWARKLSVLVTKIANKSYNFFYVFAFFLGINDSYVYFRTQTGC